MMCFTAEEVFLVNFFGDDYVQYRKETGTMLPFIGVTIPNSIGLFRHGGAVTH